LLLLKIEFDVEHVFALCRERTKIIESSRVTDFLTSFYCHLLKKLLNFPLARTNYGRHGKECCRRLRRTI